MKLLFNYLLRIIAATVITVFLVQGCSKKKSEPGYSISGNITYSYIPAKDSVSEGGDKLDYTAITTRPARRIVVEAVSGNSVVASAATDDQGRYAFMVPEGIGETMIRATSRMSASSYSADGISPDNCHGGSFSVVVRDPGGAIYAISDGAGRSASDTVNYHALTSHNGTSYTSRSGGPFAILDTILTGLETVCQANPSQSFPDLNVYWSPNYSTLNIPGGGTLYDPGQTAIFVLGKEDDDTDEYDDHVIAHELSHFFEDKIFRADNIGGAHSPDTDILDQRVAFGEGYATAMSGIIFNDPVYVDTNGLKQGNGFDQNMTDNFSTDQGIYSERSIMYLIWKLFDNRDSIAGNNLGSFDRIYNILLNTHRNTPALTNLLTFAFSYNLAYGSTAESLNTLWQTDLLNPSITTINDIWDSTNVLSAYYASGGGSPRKYPLGGSLQNATFWQLYRPISAGSNVITGKLDPAKTYTGGTHNIYQENKFGAVKIYRLTGNGLTRSVAVTASSCTANAANKLALYVWQKGVRQAFNNPGSMTPSVSFPTINSLDYLVELRGFASVCSSWTLQVN